MSFLKVGGPAPKQKTRLYIMEITLPSGLTVVKVGKSSGVSSKERMLQICASIYDADRRTPMIKIVRDREVDSDVVFKYETILHRFFTNYRFADNSTKKWDGITECFVVPVQDAVDAYMLVIDGHEPDFVYELPEVEEDTLPDGF